MAITPEEKAQRAQAFLTGLVALVPEGPGRDQAQAIFASLGTAETAAEYVASHVLRQEDYSRSMNEGAEATTKKQGELDALVASLQGERGRLDEWWKVNEPVLKEAKLLKDAGKWPGSPTPTPVPTVVDPLKPAPTPTPVLVDANRPLTQADLDARLKQFGEEALPIMSMIPKLSLEHFKTFEEVLDVDTLTKHPKLPELGLMGVYQEVYKEKLDKIVADAETAKIDAAKDEGRKEAREEILKSSGPPYAFMGQTPTAPIDLLAQPADVQKAAIDAADPAALAQQYMQKVSEVSPDDAGWHG